MPAVGPQGSKGGLLAAVVVFTILFVTATIFAIYFGVDDNKKTDLLDQANEKTRLIYSGADVVSPPYVAISKNLPRGRTVMQVAFANSQALAEMISGKNTANQTDPTAAAERARAALTDASDRLKTLNLTPNMDLVSVVNKLTEYADYLQHENTNLRMAQSDAAGDAAKQITLLQTEVTKAQQDVSDANKVKDAALDAQQKAENDYQLKAKDMQMAMDGQYQKMNAELQQAQQLQQNTAKSLATEQMSESELIAKLNKRRVNPIDPMLRQPDGTITSVASEDVVYISLGAGDHIVPGITFEFTAGAMGFPSRMT
jgi:hypothetical protein